MQMTTTHACALVSKTHGDDFKAIQSLLQQYDDVSVGGFNKKCQTLTTFVTPGITNPKAAPANCVSVFDELQLTKTCNVTPALGQIIC